jgi:uncharacterized membrane protein
LIATIAAIWIYTATDKEMSFTMALFPVLSLFLMLMGNYLQAVKPNYFIGIRTPWTLQDERNWVLTHRLGGRVYMIGGLLLLSATLLIGNQGFNTFFLIGLLLVILIPFGYSFLLYTRTESLNK